MQRSRRFVTRSHAPRLWRKSDRSNLVGIYDGRHAELYDLFYGAKPYAAEASYLHGLLQRFSGHPVLRVLDIACGTGSHAIELERLGYDVLGSDISDDMLARAKAKAQE